MPPTKLTRERRREIVLAALSGISPTTLSREYGISRPRIYDVVEEDTSDAAAELEYRRRVVKLLEDRR